MAEYAFGSSMALPPNWSCWTIWIKIAWTQNYCHCLFIFQLLMRHARQNLSTPFVVTLAPNFFLSHVLQPFLQLRCPPLNSLLRFSPLFVALHLLSKSPRSIFNLWIKQNFKTKSSGHTPIKMNKNKRKLKLKINVESKIIDFV